MTTASYRPLLPCDGVDPVSLPAPNWHVPQTSLTLHDALPVLVSLVLALPGPARHAAQADPLAPLRRRRPRLAAVAAVEALKQLLVAAGPRALHSLKVGLVLV